MAISPIGLFVSADPTIAAAELQTLANSSTLSALAGGAGTNLTSFAVQLGRTLAATGSLALNTTSLFGGTGAAGTTGTTSGLFDLLLQNSLGVRPFNFSSNALPLVFGGTNGTVTVTPPSSSPPPNSTDLGGIFFRSGADGTLFVQVRLAGLNFDINLSPTVFSTSVLAQRFQVGDGTETL